MWYGSQVDQFRCAQNQVEQDKNAESLSRSVAVSRAGTKATSAYDNYNRCVVDHYAQDGGEILKKLKEKELPKALQELAPEKREAYVKEKVAERKKLQAEISKLSKERESYLQTERTRRAEATGEATLGDAVVMAIQKQLVQSGFQTE